MPVAISFPDAVNSAAPFLNGVVRADSASGAASLTAKEESACETCSAPPKGGLKDQEFDAVLAFLISGGVLPQTAVVVPAISAQLSTMTTTANTALTSVDVGSNVGGTANSVGVGQTTIQSGNSASQKKAAPLISAMASKLPEDIAISDTGGNEIVPGGTLNDTVSSAVIDAKTGIAAAKPVQSPMVSTAKFVTDDLRFVATPASDPAAARPMSLDMINALERIGRSPEVTGTIVSAVQLTKLATAAATSLEPTASITDSSVIATPAAVAVDATVRTATVPAVTIPATIERAAIPEPTGPTSAITLPTLPTGTLPTAALVASRQVNAPTTTLPTTVSQELATTLVSPLADTPVHFSELTPSDAVPKKTSNTAPATQSPSIAEGSVLSGGTASVPSLKSDPSAATPISDPVSALGRLEPFAKTAKSRPSSDADSPMSDLGTSQSSSTAQSAAMLTSATAMSGGVLSSVANALPSPEAPVSGGMRQPLTSQVSQAIMDHIEHNGIRPSDSLLVRLDPPELGEMTIELSKTPEGLAIRVTAREAVTMDMLLVRGQEIESQLRGQHMNLKSLEFQRTETSYNGSSQGQGQQQQQNNASRRSENLMNQMRGGARSLNPTGTSMARSATLESTHGLSFRA